jgi:acyl-CoA thioesterase-2
VDLEQATRLQGEDGCYTALVSREWEIWGPNGGYLAALALRAAGAGAELPQPASFYCHFLRSPAFEAVELGIEVIKRSRRSEALAVHMAQGGKPVLEALVRTAGEEPGLAHERARAPEVLSAEELRSTEELLAEHERPPFPFWQNIERRPIDQRPPSARDPEEPGAALVREWTRFRPVASFADPFLDAARSLILLDTYGWPAVHRLHRDDTYLAPNLDTTVFFHRFSPHAEWLLIDEESPIGAHGLLAVNGRVWDPEGRLLASGAAQLCCIPAASA